MQVTLVIDTSIVDSLRYRRYIDNRPLASRSYLRCSHAVYFKSPDLRLYGGATLKHVLTQYRMLVRRVLISVYMAEQH